MNLKSGPFRPWLIVLALSFLMVLAIACVSPSNDVSSSSQTANASGDRLRELRIFVEPRACATYLVDPQGVEGTRYEHGTPVTISLVAREDCQVKEWINVDSFSGMAGKVNMNADRIVQVNMVTGQTALAPTSAPNLTNATQPTEIPSPTLSPTDLPPTSVPPTSVPPTAAPGPAPKASPSFLSRVMVEPNAAGLDIGESQQFTFKAFDESGEEIAGAIAVWSVDPVIGTIDSNGLFTAGTKADFFLGAVEVDVVLGRLRAYSSVDIVIDPDPLASITIDPAAAPVSETTPVQLSAIGYDQYGNDIGGLEFQWTSTSGLTVNQDGQVTQASFSPANGIVGWWRGEGNADDSVGANNGSAINDPDYVDRCSRDCFQLQRCGPVCQRPARP